MKSCKHDRAIDVLVLFHPSPFKLHPSVFLPCPSTQLCVAHFAGVFLAFEHFALVTLMFVIAGITLFAFCATIAQLFADLGASFMDKVALQDTFGSILTVLILLEFNHSIFAALTRRTGAIQVRIVVPRSRSTQWSCRVSGDSPGPAGRGGRSATHKPDRAQPF